jgi:hypothetical protein
MDDAERPIEEATPDLSGENYLVVLKRLHAELKPRTYLEVGTSRGESLRFVTCATVSVDPAYQLTEHAVGQKPVCRATATSRSTIRKRCSAARSRWPFWTACTAASSCCATS